MSGSHDRAASDAGAAAEQVDPRLLGGRYRILDEIGSGGMGVVYRALDESTGMELALKQLLHRRAVTSQAITLFEREYQTLASLSHPRIIRVFDYGKDEAGPYYTMELLEGKDLRELAPLPYRDACRYLRDVAASLALLHTRRLVHRDVTPRNVRVTAQGYAKLLDFGALSGFGVADNIVGTPPSVPPEALSAGNLDQRSDLFSLGALAYWLLTGQQAFAARHLNELPELWNGRLKPPSSVSQDVPAELDQLVLQLLRRDPLARPASAAEVIDRLNHLAGLEQEQEHDVLAFASSYLTDARLVDREQQLARIGASLSSAGSGEGRTLWVEASSGMGRSRLLREASVQAQLLGACVVSVDADGSQQPFDTVRRLVVRLLQARPRESRALARVQLDALSRIDRGLAQRLGGGSHAGIVDAGDDYRVDAQLAFQELFVEPAKRDLLVICVDNVDRADDASAAFLVALARLASQLKLLLLVSCRQQPDGAAPSSALRLLRERSEALDLDGFAAPATAELMGSLFGGADNLLRFSEWVHETTSGSPLYCIELVRQLLAAGVVRYVDGMWILPAERPDMVRSKALEEVLAGRLTKLGSPARQLAEALSVMRGTLTIELCAKLAERIGSVDVHTLLNELKHARVLTLEAQSCAFANDALREAVIASMGEARRQKCQRDGADMLLKAYPNDLTARVEAGRQLMEGGELSRGADVVRKAVQGVTLDAGREELRLAVQPCARALEIYEAEGRTTYERAPLLAVLASSSFYVDWRWGDRVGATALSVLQEASGLALAIRLRRLLGARLALVFGLSIGAFRFMLRGRGVGYSFVALIEWLFSVSLALAGAAAVLLDRHGVRRAVASAEPFAVLGLGAVPGFAYEYARRIELALTDRWADSVKSWTEMLEMLERSEDNPVPEASRQGFLGGAWFVLGVAEAFRAGEGALRCALKLDQTGFAMYRMQAHQLRSAYHAYRGELSKAARYTEFVELYAAQIGSAWQVEVWYPTSTLLVCGAIGDVTLCRRVAERLQALSREIPTLRFYALHARGCLQLVRGDLDGCVETYNQVLLDSEPLGFAGWAAVIGFRANALNQLGHHELAKASCEAALEKLTPADREFVNMCIWPQIELALAEAGLANFERAARLLEACLAAGDGGDNPLVRGSLHHARARVALLAGDREAFGTHRAETERWFVGTGTPALIARSEQLIALELRAPWRPRSAPATRPAQDVEAMLAECDTDERRAERALEIILKMSGGQEGVLFRVAGGTLLRLSHKGEPETPLDVQEQLLALANDVSSDSTTATQNEPASGFSDMSEGSVRNLSGYRLLLLTVSHAGELSAVGAVAVRDAPAYQPPSFDCLNAIAHSLAPPDLGPNSQSA